MASTSIYEADYPEASLFVHQNQSIVRGLQLLEQLCASGIWVPAWIVGDHLKNMNPHSGAWALILARILQLQNACEILEKAECNVLGVDARGFTILHCIVAQYAPKPAIKSPIRTHFSGDDNIDYYFNLSEMKHDCHSDVCAENVRLGTAKFLISFEKDLVTTTSYFDELPLHIATEQGIDELLPCLIKAGSDVNGRTEFADTPLHCGAQRGHDKCCRILLDNGADIASVAELGFQPIHDAVANDSVECVRLLLKRGADVNALAEYELAPLHICVSEKCLEAAKVLIEKGADLNPIDRDGRTPLHKAVNCHCTHQEHMDVLNLLIKAGASLNTRDFEGNTPLHLAVGMKNRVTVQCLVDAGADTSITDSAGCTALQVAQHNNAKACEEILKTYDGVKSLLK